MGYFCLICEETTGLTGGLNSFVFLWADGVPPTFIFGVVLNKLFLFLFADKSDVFFNRFIRTRFPEAPDLDDVYDFGFALLLVSEGALSLEATLLA